MNNYTNIHHNNSVQDNSKTTIVIPCYNEAQRLNSKLFTDLAKAHTDTTLLFVNDGSKDTTLDLLKNLASQQQNIQFLDLKTNLGKAEAVRQGVLYAHTNIPSHCIAFYDADMATPFSDLLKMSDFLLENDQLMVTGCRLKRMGGDINRRYSRFILGRIFATCAANVLCLPVYDTQCGAKVFHNSIISKIFNDKFVSSWLFDIELFARIILTFDFNTALTRITEYPLSSWTEVGDSKLKFKDVIRQPLNLFRINKHYKIKKYVKQTCH